MIGFANGNGSPKRSYDPLSRSNGSPRSSFVYINNGGAGEQAQTYFLDRQNSIHRNMSKFGVDVGSAGAGGTPGSSSPSSFKFYRSNSAMLRSFSELVAENSNSINNSSNNNNNNSVTNNRASSPLLLMPPRNSTSNLTERNSSYGSLNQKVLSEDTATTTAPTTTVRTIRFQVLIWNIGRLDVVSGAVPMTFRVTLFWNDDGYLSNNNKSDENLNILMNDDASSVGSVHVWKMHGRQKAFQQELKDVPIQAAVDVPPLAILNVSTFETIGSPDIDMLNESTRLMRWTCMYRATVIQDNIRVDAFPHDDHDIHLKLAILANRGIDRAWDRRYWKLGLATVEDTQSSVRVPHGLIVNQARIPGFSYNKDRGLKFQFCNLDHGLFESPSADNTNNGKTYNVYQQSSEQYLRVSLNVLRESGYYDRNIVPLLALLNLVAVSVLTFEDGEFFYRGLITLNIAFTQMGIRMTTDTHLPHVDYEIRLQRILNEFFVVLMMLVLEAMLVYVLGNYYHVNPVVTKVIDWMMGFFVLFHNVYTLYGYYDSKRKAKERLIYGWHAENEKNN